MRMADLCVDSTGRIYLDLLKRIKAARECQDDRSYWLRVELACIMMGIILGNIKIIYLLRDLPLDKYPRSGAALTNIMTFGE